MKLNKLYIALGLISVFYLTACKKESSPLSDTNVSPVNFSQVFDQFWNGMNTNY